MTQNTLGKHLNNWLADSYGSRRGFVYTYAYRIMYLMGKYRAYKQIDWGGVGRLVFVCKGNLYRSPFAEAVAGSLGIESISFGMLTKLGSPANNDAISAATKVGIDLKQHKTRTLESLIFRKNDLIIAMEPIQIEILEKELKNVTGYTLLGLWGNSIYPYIPDPFASSPAYIEKCFKYIEHSVHEIAKKIG